jgi:hypothetical protein
MKCLHCGRETAFNATVCPFCGANPPHGGAQANDGLAKLLGSGLAIFILGKFFGLW